MRIFAIAAGIFLCTTGAIWADMSAQWQRGGGVSVNGKTVAGSSYLKSGRSYVFPVLAVAQALNKKATVDAATATITWDGRAVKAPSLVVVDGVAYANWRDLSRAEPQLEYGIDADRVVFALNARKTMPSVSAQPVAVAAVSWTEDLAAARARATAENKRILLDFTGSDWCGWCKKLEAEVFDTPAFKAYAQQNLVLVRVDFPRTIPQSDSLKEQNKVLMDQFHVEGFPTVVVLSPDGHALGVTGYKEGGAPVMLKDLEKMK